MDNGVTYKQFKLVLTFSSSSSDVRFWVDWFWTAYFSLFFLQEKPEWTCWSIWSPKYVVVGEREGAGRVWRTILWLSWQVSKLLEPSIILVEDIDRVFVKKSSGSDRNDRKRMRKEIPKLVKNCVFVEDRIMLIGTSSTPWECDQKVSQHPRKLPRTAAVALVCFTPFSRLRPSKINMGWWYKCRAS